VPQTHNTKDGLQPLLDTLQVFDRSLRVSQQNAGTSLIFIFRKSSKAAMNEAQLSILANDRWRYNPEFGSQEESGTPLQVYGSNELWPTRELAISAKRKLTFCFCSAYAHFVALDSRLS
jgi:hypothetical protein